MHMHGIRDPPLHPSQPCLVQCDMMSQRCSHYTQGGNWNPPWLSSCPHCASFPLRSIWRMKYPDLRRLSLSFVVMLQAACLACSPLLHQQHCCSSCYPSTYRVPAPVLSEGLGEWQSHCCGPAGGNP